MTAVVSCHGVGKRFGALHAVDNVDLDVAAGARHAIIGPNGAGKSTLLHLISGVVRASAGTVRLDGQAITRLSEARRARLGLSRTFQHASLFPTRSAATNVVLALQRSRGVRPWPTSRLRRELADEARGLLATVGLADHEHVAPAALAHGERRQLEIAVALACRPRVLLLDEPAAGLSAAQSEALAELLEQIPPEVTVLFVEHDLDLVFRLATRITVLHLGQELLTGSAQEVRASPVVREAYLGTENADRELFLAGAAQPAEGESPVSEPHRTRGGS